MKRAIIVFCASLIMVNLASCDPNHTKKFSRIAEDDISGYEEFIQKYPSSTMVAEAKNRITTAKHKNWIYNNLPDRVWDNLALDAINKEYRRLVDLLTDYANSNIDRYYDKERDIEESRASSLGSTYYDNSLSNQFNMSLWGIETASDARRRRNNAIEAYKSRYNSVTSNLKSSFESCLSYKDSTITDDWKSYGDKEICDMLLGSVTSGTASGTYYNCMMISQNVIKRVLSGLSHPVISSCSFNEEKDLWVVRLDHADNYYVKFFPRDDGDFDIEYSSNPERWGY